MIIKENRVIRVAGVEYYGQDAQQDKQIFHFDGTHVVGAESGPDKLIPKERREKWPVNKKTDLELIHVKSFLPDINALDSRRLSPAPYTKVNAYLVGTEDWESDKFNCLIISECVYPFVPQKFQCPNNYIV